MTLDTFLYVALSGLVLGGIYALMATGLSIVWTTLGVFNFAHGTFLALGAYIAWEVAHRGNGGPLMFFYALLISMIVMFVLGYLLHFILVKPFERNPSMLLLGVVSTLAAATIIENGIFLTWGPRDKQIGVAFDGKVELFGGGIAYQDILAVGVAILSLVGLSIFLRKSTTGRAMRAVAQNPEAAELMGFRVTHLFALTLGLSAAIAALAGVFVGSLRFMSPGFGADPLMKSLIVIILGGVGHFMSPIGAAFILGFIEVFCAYFIGFYWTPAVLFLLMILTLLLRPEGLFGSPSKTL